MKTYNDFVVAAQTELAKAACYDREADDCEYGSAAQQYIRENADDCRTLAKRYNRLADAKR